MVATINTVVHIHNIAFAITKSEIYLGNTGKNTWNARAIPASQARLNDLQSHHPKQNMKNILTNLESCGRFKKYSANPLALFFRPHIWKSPAAINAGKPFV